MESNCNGSTNDVRDVPFAKVDCGGRELEYVAEVLESGWLTTASKSKDLEQKFVELIGCKHAIAVNSCTSALHLALDACGVKPGDKVLLPSLTFTATAEVVRYMGADPVLMDVRADTKCVDGEIIETSWRANPGVTAVIVVHYAGYPVEMTNAEGTGVADVCGRLGVRLINDSAHALPARRDGRMVGLDGDVTCFSFYANKTMTSGEGGMLVTSSDEIAKRAKLMRLHGIDRDVWDRFTSGSARWEYDVVAPGFKYNMPDLNAAVGLAQFERLEEMRLGRQRCAELYLKLLEGHDLIELPLSLIPAEDHAWHLFPVQISENSSIGRNDLIDRLGDVGVGSSVHYKPIHRLKYYKERYDLDPLDFPVADRVWKTTISLPIYSLLTDEDVEFVCMSLRNALGSG